MTPPRTSPSSVPTGSPPNARDAGADREHPTGRRRSRSSGPSTRAHLSSGGDAPCTSSRTLASSERTGTGAHELLPDGVHQPGRAGLVARRDAPPVLRGRRLYLTDRERRRRPAPWTPAASLPAWAIPRWPSPATARDSSSFASAEDPSAIPTRDDRDDGPRERSGRELRSTRPTPSAAPGWSPDGTADRLLPVPARRTTAVPTAPMLTRSGWSMRTARTCTRSARRRSPPQYPEWSPDGTRIAVRVERRASSRTSTRSGPTGPMCVA